PPPRLLRWSTPASGPEFCLEDAEGRRPAVAGTVIRARVIGQTDEREGHSRAGGVELFEFDTHPRCVIDRTGTPPGEVEAGGFVDVEIPACGRELLSGVGNAHRAAVFAADA